MAPHFENPFSDYEPPAGLEVFSIYGKIGIVQFKVRGIADEVKNELVEGDKLVKLNAGEYIYRYNYDFSRLDPYIAFQDEASALDLARRSVVKGCYAALRERGMELGRNKALGHAAAFDSDEPR